jgi:hypothetical protein
LAGFQVVPLGDFGHRAGGLAGRQEDQPAVLRRLGQRVRQKGRRMGRRHRATEQAFEEFP